MGRAASATPFSDVPANHWAYQYIQSLAADGIITAKRDPSDGRSKIYLLTAKGIGLAPALTELVLWAAAHETTGRPALVRKMREDKTEFLAGVLRGWKQRGR